MRVFFQSIIAQLLLTPYIAWRGGQALPARRVWRYSFWGCLGAEWLLFWIGYLFHKELPDAWMIFILSVCNTWYIASLYIALSLFCIELLCWSHRKRPWFPRWITTHEQPLRRWLFVLIGVADLFLMITAYQRVAHPVVRHLTVEIPKRTSLPGDSLRIVMMSDLHIGEMIGKEQVQRYVELSNAQHPDLVVLVGDIMDYESRFAEKAHIEEDLQQLQSRYGTYIVLGNHEYRANRFAKLRWLRRVGTLLVDSVAMPDSAFYLIGRDDLVNKRRAPLQALVHDLDRSKPWIVLDHQPLSFYESAMNGVDLALHGHTHGGQIWPNSWAIRLAFECPYGPYEKGPTHFYVSSGIGCAGPPYRVGTSSELVVLTIHFSH